MSTLSEPEIDPAIEVVDDKALFRFKPLEREKGVDGQDKGNDHRRTSDHADGTLAQTFLNLGAEQAIDNGAEQRQEYDPAYKIGLYGVIHLTFDLKPRPILDSLNS